MTSLDDDHLPAGLDLAAKVRLLTGASAFTLAPSPALGLGEVRLSDGPTGVRGLKFSGGPTVALLPNATLLASSWSPDAAYAVGAILAEEALAQQIHVVLGPTINLHRSALGGRLFEAYSEDSLLSGRLAAAYVRGLQDGGVGACLKHLVANESETERNTVDCVVDEATLRELYLLPFEIAVADAGPWAIMSAYNDVNGVPSTENHHVQNRIVKGEWGFDGVIVSDWFATKSAAPAANGGLDLVMPGPKGPWGDALVADCAAGRASESVIDDSLRRLLRLAHRVGALGAPRSYPSDAPSPGGPRRREQLTRLAAGGMTVLTNREQTLPLDRSARVALIGRHAVETITMGGGSAQVNPPHQVDVATGLAELLGDNLRVVDGVEVRNRPVSSRRGILREPSGEAPGAAITLHTADGSPLEERHSPTATTVVGFDDDFDGAVRTIRFSARLTADGPVQVGVSGVGAWRLRVDGHEWHDRLAVSGSGLGEEILRPPTAAYDVEVRAGALLEASVVIGESEDDAGPLGVMGSYALIARPAPRDPGEVLAEATAAASAADVAVVVVGLTEEQETEAVDKSTLQLPGEQDALVAAVAAVAGRTVVVVNAATPVLMPWRDDVDAILWAGLPGQEAGHAVAAALLGDIEPGGRLVTSFPAADGAAPAWSVTPVDGRLVYTEGTAIGYRGYDAGRAPQPAFWFGHGLGYATWEYGPLQRVADAATGAPVVSVAVTNTGSRPSREVVQIYFRPAGDRPIRLVGWSDVTVSAGEAAEVVVPTDARLYRRWDTDAAAWDGAEPTGELLVARGLGDVRGTLRIGGDVNDPTTPG